MQSRRPLAVLLCAALLDILGTHSASAETQLGCRSPVPLATSNLVVHCRYVTIEIEAGAVATLVGRDQHGEPSAVNLRSGAIYVDDHPAADREPFQIRTPDAIASVRGTSWAVDVSAARSSVFVVAGSVQVRRRLDQRSVRLTAGEGVDVEAETNPLVVKRWPAPRVRALLNRLGR